MNPYQYSQYEQSLIQNASMYELLSNYYKYIDPNKHMMYYMKHYECMRQLTGMHRTAEEQRSQQSQSNQQTMSYIRVLHASPNAPNVDVYVNGQKLLQNVAFKQVSQYVPVMAGDYRIKITPTGKTEAVLTKDIRVEPGQAYTVAAAGNVEELTLVPYVDDTTSVQGQAKARFIHLSPDAPRVDIAVKGGDVLFPNVGFKEATNYVTLPPTQVDLEVRPAGTKQVVLTIPGVSLEGNNVYNAVAVGYANGEPSLEAIFI
ncbi:MULTISPECIES: DUF4397 domain-containing protein [Pontibacillus]|uniref:DUF4397 domain-containing protein n=1 Tax=Pontibacillus chungwhensis TaxID=265426 RepID=A0ABY8US89_9BACI|nr:MULTISPECIES: DUF4397 domain-containing protein [Pontibacillus]MCD5322891.1 DUF4397 domain-containing protein [Pontibacillus sp. HN14]WIF96288.1 DUF4397 domain-containing protein [Pontibacillus chungwhensis]